MLCLSLILKQEINRVNFESKTLQNCTKVQNQYNAIIHEYEETIILNDAYKMSFQKEETNPKKYNLEIINTQTKTILKFVSLTKT